MIARHEIIIIGAGFAGIGLALQLKRAGSNDFHVIEAEEGIGGTWWLNRYPGAACDVQSHLYSLSFAPNAQWSRHFPPREEIQTHLQQTAEKENLHEHISLSTRLTRACWIDADKEWELTTADRQRWRCSILISAVGGLARPLTPSIDGLEQFQGRLIHSQRWPLNLDLTGQRVGVIGTGASAVQFVPHVARQAEALFIYQRTPNWILPKPDRAIPKFRRYLYERIPVLRYLTRLGLFLLLETRLPAFTRWPSLSFFHRRKALRHLKHQVKDEVLVKNLIPNYQMGCKRVLMSNDFYPVFNQPHVSLITDPIQRITREGIETTGNQTQALDVLILATGFNATSPVPKDMIIGRDNLDLAEVWLEGPTAYKGSAIHGFPNFFMLMGPNTALGHNSVLLMMEGQMRYIMHALKLKKARGWANIEVTEKAQRQWNAFLDKTLSDAVWSGGGCKSWYLHPKSGRNTTLWPHTTLRFRWLTRRFDSTAYRCE